MLAVSVIGLVLILCFLAVAAYFTKTKVPAGAIQTIILVVLIIVAIVLALSAFGVWDEIRGVQVPKI